MRARRPHLKYDLTLDGNRGCRSTPERVILSDKVGALAGSRGIVRHIQPAVSNTPAKNSSKGDHFRGLVDIWELRGSK